MDRRGRGASGDEPSYSLVLEVADVVAVVPTPVFLYGHSFGGTCAREAALRSPSLAGRHAAHQTAPGLLADVLREAVDAMSNEGPRVR